MATHLLLVELAEDYQRLSGQPVHTEWVGGWMRAGEAFDVVMLAADAIEELAAARRIEPATRIDIARSGVAMAVAAGAPAPDVGSTSAIRQTLLAARSIGHSTGPNGAHLARLFERWGIAETIAPRLVQAPPGVPVGSLVAHGEVEVGFQQLSELMPLEGIQIVGSLTSEIQIITVFTAAICMASARREAAGSFLSFLRGR